MITKETLLAEDTERNGIWPVNIQADSTDKVLRMKLAYFQILKARGGYKAYHNGSYESAKQQEVFSKSLDNTLNELIVLMNTHNPS